MKVECWLVVQAKPNQYGPSTYPTGHPYAGQRQIGQMKAVRIAQKKPACAEDEQAFRIEFDVDEGWFLEGIAKVTATIPAPQQGQDIAAQVDLPVRGRAKSAAAAVIQP